MIVHLYYAENILQHGGFPIKLLSLNACSRVSSRIFLTYYYVHQHRRVGAYGRARLPHAGVMDLIHGQGDVAYMAFLCSFSA